MYVEVHIIYRKYIVCMCVCVCVYLTVRFNIYIYIYIYIRFANIIYTSIYIYIYHIFTPPFISIVVNDCLHSHFGGCFLSSPTLYCYYIYTRVFFQNCVPISFSLSPSFLPSLSLSPSFPLSLSLSLSPSCTNIVITYMTYIYIYNHPYIVFLSLICTLSRT